MGIIVIILLLGIILILWIFGYKSIKKFDQLIEIIEAQNETHELVYGLTNKQYLSLIFQDLSDIKDYASQILSIATKEHPAGVNFHKYIRSDNLANIYADYLESYNNLPQHLAIKRARFEVTKFGQEDAIKKINSSFRYGIEYQRKQTHFADFFSSGIIEKDIKNHLKEKIIYPSDIFAPLYDLIVNQGYSGEKDFVAE